MAGRILIHESVATNRIILRCKLAAACYEVVQAERLEDLARLALAGPVDAILLDAGDCPESLAQRLQRAGIRPGETGTPVILMADAGRARMVTAGLAAGAEAVVPRPVDERFLMAVLRRALRSRAADHDPVRLAGLPVDFAFAEPAAAFEPMHQVCLCAPGPAGSPGAATALAPLAADLDRALPARVSSCEAAQLLAGRRAGPAADAIVVVARPGAETLALQMIADLRSRPATCDAAILVAIDGPARRLPAPGGAPDSAGGLATLALALDLGADDVLPQGCEAEELALRLRRQLRRRQARSQLRERVTAGLRLAAHDPLTGLYNRRVALPRLRELAAGAAAGGTPLAVMLIDLDRFKLVNDTHGHATGDRVLTEVAGRLAAECSGNDLLARIGGEEFLLALPGAGLAAAERRADRLSQALRGRPFCETDAPGGISVTASIGLAVFDGGEAPPPVEELLQQADSALLASKAEGRDQVKVARSAA